MTNAERETLQALVEKWRERSGRRMDYDARARTAIAMCADELSAALAALTGKEPTNG